MDRLKRYRESYPVMDGDFIFRTDAGTPLDPDNWTKRVFPAIRTRAELRDFGLHTLRHYAGSSTMPSDGMFGSESDRNYA